MRAQSCFCGLSDSQRFDLIVKLLFYFACRKIFGSMLYILDKVADHVMVLVSASPLLEFSTDIAFRLVVKLLIDYINCYYHHQSSFDPGL